MQLLWNLKIPKFKSFKNERKLLMERKLTLYMYTVLLYFRTIKYKHLQDLIIIDWIYKHGWRFIPLLQFWKTLIIYMQVSSSDTIKFVCRLSSESEAARCLLKWTVGQVIYQMQIRFYFLFIQCSSDFYHVYFWISIWSDNFKEKYCK